jgi:transcriptional regulator with XRE-family HTH domain
MDVVRNIIEIRKRKGITQETIADALNLDVAVVSNIEKGKRELKVSELEIISKALEVDVLYLLTYPDEYVKKGENTDNTERISVTFEISPDKRDVLLNLITKK